MKVFLSIIFGLIIGTLAIQAQDETFTKAQAAYDNGRYAEAALLYEQLISNGISNPEVHYNLANACFKDHDLSKAIWHYRKAWYENPRDPDINANLHFALNAAGAIEPAPSMAERFFSILTYSEWILVATAGYLLLMLLLLLLLFVRHSRRPLLKLCLLPTAMILCSILGGLHWKRLQANPEWVVVKMEATALFGPIEGSTAHFKLPVGALVQQHALDSKGWVEVEYDGKQGWLKDTYITRISP